MTRFQPSKRLLPYLSAATVFFAGAAAAQPGQGQSGGTYRLTASVPVACWVRPTGTVLASAGLTGSVVEACNSPGGFTVSANYRPLKSNEMASLNYGGQLINLTPSGEQELRRSTMATIRTVNYRFEDVALDEPLILSLVIQPI
jgi:hypothetical protein